MLNNRNFFIDFITYLFNLTTKLTHKKSVLGASLLLLITVQCLSGVMLSFSFIPEIMLVPGSRDEEDSDDLYTDDFFWIHERLVDLIFITMYLHASRKLSSFNFTRPQYIAWITGSTLWLLLHFSIFLGLCLCSTHLSDITLTIAANIMHTLCVKTGKPYWWFFTNQTLNSDTLTRLSLMHYFISLLLFCYSYSHAFDMHFDWKDINLYDSVDISMSWLFYTFKYEISFMLEFIFVIYEISKFFYVFNETLSYEIFMWGDVGIVVEPRYLGVAPHWYFRSYMGWLIVCPHHYIGVFGLIYYIIIFYCQPFFKKMLINYNQFLKKNYIKELNLIFLIFLVLFLFSVMYTSSTLPYGKFYNRVKGNNILLLSYMYIFLYMTRVVHLVFITLFDLCMFDSSLKLFFRKKIFPTKKIDTIVDWEHLSDFETENNDKTMEYLGIKINM